ncbi:MAG TPA: hypothetical protein VF911_14860, partial [Thermoanaerobaculia bacterium]
MKRALLIFLLAFSAAAQPRAINDNERAAVEAVAGFLEEGPRAIYTRLSSDAPLRTLPESDALRELSVRMGPRDGARWTLQTVQGSADHAAFRVTFPSGYEDGLLFRMKHGRVHQVVTLAEVVPGMIVPAEAVAPEPPTLGAKMRTALSPPAMSERIRRAVSRTGLPHNVLPTAKTPRRTKSFLAATIVLALVAALVPKTRVLFALLAIATLAAALYEPAQEQARGFAELRDLEPLRAALARGDKPPEHPANDIAQLWILQSGAP